MKDVNAVAITGGPNGDSERRQAGDEEAGDWGYGDIAQNEQIATPDGPMSREELEDADAEGVFVIEYRF